MCVPGGQHVRVDMLREPCVAGMRGVCRGVHAGLRRVAACPPGLSAHYGLGVALAAQGNTQPPACSRGRRQTLTRKRSSERPVTPGNGQRWSLPPTAARCVWVLVSGGSGESPEQLCGARGPHPEARTGADRPGGPAPGGAGPRGSSTPGPCVGSPCGRHAWPPGRLRTSRWPGPGWCMGRPGEARPVMLQCRPAEEFSFGPRALKDALLSTDPALRQLYTATFSPAERLFLAEAYNPQRTLFGTLLIRTAFDWLLSRPEAPEDFQTFHAALPPRKQSLARKHIYLQPIDLSEGPAGSALLDQLRSCTEAFFLGLQVRCLPSVAATSIHCSSRPSQDPDRLQLHTDGILSFLKSSKPGDALCVLGLTLSDLYPREAWTFTFGTFLPGHEVGVCSFARFSGEFLPRGPSTPDLPEVEVAAGGSEAPLQDGGQAVCFSALGMVQCCKVTCHELCHLLGLGNCRWLRCLMQGALRVDEALRRPLDLCPICLRKLQHLLGFRLVDRYKRLYAWIQAAAGTQPGPAAAGEPSVSEDTLPCSADSGLCCESDSEPGSSLSETLSPDAWSQAFPAGLELEPEDGLGSLAATEGPGEALAEHGRWLAACIQALERDVSEGELEQVDGAVDALAPWDLFTGQLPAPRQDLPCGRDGVGLRRVLGDTFSSLRRKLSARRPSRAESSPRRQKAEDD